MKEILKEGQTVYFRSPFKDKPVLQGKIVTVSYYLKLSNGKYTMARHDNCYVTRTEALTKQRLANGKKKRGRSLLQRIAGKIFGI